MSKTFQATDFQDEEVIRIFVTTFDGQEFEFFGVGGDVNNNTNAGNARFKKLCGENKVGFKGIQKMKFENADGQNCAYGRDSRDGRFKRTEW